jgi:tripartite-type tricarboxylate transporter receptor subunit TctC
MGQVKSGALRPIAVTTERRSLAMPDLPTIAETIPGYSASTWYGLYAPRGTPPEIIGFVNHALLEVLASPVVRKQMLDDGFEPAGNTPEEFARFIHSEIAKWGKVANAAGIEPE